jgi:beta-glucosidase
MDWEVYPDGLADTLRWFRDRYGATPLYVTENGAAFYDAPASEDLEPDSLRLRYLREHVIAARRAIEAGVDLRGYFVWSLLDNFEWSHGFSKRFGIVHVDYRTQKRTPKASARFYAEIIRSNGVSVGKKPRSGPSGRRARSPRTSRSSRRR